MTENLFGIIGIEALTAAQGVELRAPLSTSPELSKAIAAIRSKVPTLDTDRYMDVIPAFGLNFAFLMQKKT